jgi:hypothetical protein
MRPRWVVGLSFHWPKRSLTSNATPELLLHFLTAALLDRVCAATQGQQSDCQRN